MLREQIREIKTTPATLRSFGLLLTIFLSVLAGLAWWKGQPTQFWFFPMALVVLLVAFAQPLLLRFVYVPWMIVALSIGWVMTRVILSSMYFVVFTPTALVLRMLGKDQLDQRIEPERESYWVKREKRRFRPPDFEHQF